MAKIAQENPSLTPHYLLQCLNCEQQMSTISFLETMAFIKNLSTEVGGPSFPDLLQSFGVAVGKKSFYSKFLNENAEEAAPSSKMASRFVTESKALCLLTMRIPKETLDEKWDEEDAGSRVQLKTLSDHFLKAMARSPLYPRLILLRKLNSVDQSSSAGLSDIGNDTTVPMSDASQMSTSLEEATQTLIEPIEGDTQVENGISLEGEEANTTNEHSDDEDSQEDDEPKEEATREEAQEDSQGDEDADPLQGKLGSEEPEEKTNTSNSTSKDCSSTPITPSTPSTTPSPNHQHPRLTDCIQILMDNQLDASFLENAFRFLHSQQTQKLRPPLRTFSPEIKICSWNTRKLSVLSRDLFVQDPVFVELSTCDIICLQEVPFASKGSSADSSIHEMKDKISRYRPFDFQVSKPSGKGDSDKKEVHAVLYAKPWILVSSHTLDPGKFDYAPFVTQFKNPNFPGYLFYFVSVHLPPEGRSRDQAQQLRRFEEAYEECVRGEIKAAYTFQGAKDAKKELPVHIIMGDFNSVPGFHSLQNAWGEGNQLTVRTSQGGRPFDHFYVSRDALSDFEAFPEVLHLVYGPEQVSDHSPIVLRLTKPPKMSSKRNSVLASE